MPIDEISVEDVNDWYETVAPGRESQRGHAYILLLTILGTAASTRPEPLIPYNPAHIRGAGNVKPAHKVRRPACASSRCWCKTFQTSTGSWPCWPSGAR